MSKTVVAALTLSMMLAALPTFSKEAGGKADGFRASLEKWVEAQMLLSKEREDWLVEKEYLQATRDLLLQEKSSLRAQVEELEATDRGASAERQQLLSQRVDHRRAVKHLSERVANLEREVLALVPRLPAPLAKRLEPLLVQIPDDPEQTKRPVGQRLMNVLGVLAQAQKFNDTVTLAGEIRQVPDGSRIQVRTLYWGLAEAIYVDGQARLAGIAHPAEDGWTFDDDPSIARNAKLLLDIHEGNVDTISFVPIPVVIQ